MRRFQLSATCVLLALASAAGQEVGRFVSEQVAALAEGAVRTLFAGHGRQKG